MSLEEQVNQLTAQVKKLSSENVELKSQLAKIEYNNSANQISKEINDLKNQYSKIETLIPKIEGIEKIISGVLYFGTFRELIERTNDIKAELDDLAKNINNSKENRVQPQVAAPSPTHTIEEEKEKLESISKEILSEKEDEITIKEPKKEVEVKKPEAKVVTPVVEEEVDIPEGFNKVNEREDASDLLISKATQTIKNMGDKLPDEEQENQEETKVENKEEVLEPAETPVYQAPNNEIEEIKEEEPQKVIATQEVNKNETKLEEVVAPNIANSINQVNDKIKLVGANIKVFKEFITNRAKTIKPKYKYDVSGTVKSMPNNVKESFDNNIVNISNFTKTDEKSKTR